MIISEAWTSSRSTWMVRNNMGCAICWSVSSIFCPLSTVSFCQWPDICGFLRVTTFYIRLIRTSCGVEVNLSQNVFQSKQKQNKKGRLIQNVVCYTANTPDSLSLHHLPPCLASDVACSITSAQTISTEYVHRPGKLISNRQLHLFTGEGLHKRLFRISRRSMLKFICAGLTRLLFPEDCRFADCRM